MPEQNAKKKVLVVDDEAGSRLLLKASLEKNGFELLQAENGLDALNLVKVNKPDLIIMDRMMPKMDGLKACAFLKLDRRFADIPVIMLTASAEKADQKLSEQVGVNAFLNKPVNTTALLEKVQELLVRGTA
ncbi:MAG: response regulator [Candidatus Omnitrophota bacterium]